MKAGQAQAMKNITASHSPQAHTHHQRPARSMSSEGRQQQRPAEQYRKREALGRSARYSAGVVRLKPKRASSRNVRHSDSGRFTSCMIRAHAAR